MSDSRLYIEEEKLWCIDKTSEGYAIACMLCHKVEDGEPIIVCDVCRVEFCGNCFYHGIGHEDVYQEHIWWPKHYLLSPAKPVGRNSPASTTSKSFGIEPIFE